MKDFMIFTEGDADVKFLYDYLEHILGKTLDKLEVKNGLHSKQIVSIGGWSKIYHNQGGENSMLQSLRLNTDKDITNLIIFDADNDFQARRKEILDWKKRYNLEFELFLFPSNKDDGELENLLEQLINTQNQPIFDCWNSFEKCLTTKKNCTKSPLTIPAKKSKIYMYMEVLHGITNVEKDKIKDRNRDFKDKNLWDLDSPMLEPLKAFLLKYCR